jgi:hypothetical protein
MYSGILDSGQKIVTDGLVLNLDAAQLRSYPTTGTTWTYLSGQGNNGTLVNGVGFDSGNGGGLTFDGVDDSVQNFPSQISGNESKTVEVWFMVNVTTRTGLCGTRPITNSEGWVLTINRTSYGNLTYFHTGGSIIEIPAGIVTNNWYQAIAAYDLTNTTAILYLNGYQIGNSITNFSNITSSTYKGRIGGEQESTSFGILNGKIAKIQIYNRALSATEIQQNYNATKSRFGL